MKAEAGKNSKHWGFRLRRPGEKARFITLRGCPVEGNPPTRRGVEGDAAYERSRNRAQRVVDEYETRLGREQDAAELLRELYRVERGTPPPRIKIEELAEKYLSLERAAPLSPRYAEQVRSNLGKFSLFIQKHHPAATHLGKIDRATIREFLRAVEAEGVSEKTWNDWLVLLGAVFRRLAPYASLPENPCAGIPRKQEATVHRAPFSVTELEKILACCKEDDDVGPLFVTLLCTALRIGRATRLAWDRVDLKRGVLAISDPGKKGAPVTIPIFPALKEVLLRCGPQPKGYVFPKLAAEYATNPDSVRARIKKLLVRSGFAETDLQVAHPSGKRRASVRGAHSCRVTWITLALMGGVPIEVVKKVTGHKITETVLTHYLQADGTAIRHTLAGRLPQLLVGEATPSEHLTVRAILGRLGSICLHLESGRAAPALTEIKHLIADLQSCSSDRGIAA